MPNPAPTTHSGRRWGIAAAVVAILAAIALVVPSVTASDPRQAEAGTPTPEAGTPTDATVTRFAGTSRFDTATLIATGSFADVDRVVVARGGDWPDALAGNFLAGALQAPVLLIGRDDVPKTALDALTALGTSEVVLLGGPAAISEETAQVLVDAGLTVQRVRGASRYETAVAVAEQATSVQRGTTAVVTTGENFADALVIGPVAWSEGYPLLLTPGASLHPATREYLTDPTITDVIIPGGTAAVSDAVEAELVAMGKQVQRLSGPGRVETAVAIATFALEELGYGAEQVFMATADPFADALALGAAAGAGRNPLLIASGQATTLNAELDAFLRTHGCTTTAVSIAGGTGAFGEAAAQAVVAAANACDAMPTETPEPEGITAPRLAGIALVSTTAAGSTYRYTFDRAVTVPNPTADAIRFRLSTPFTSQIIEPMVQPLDAPHRPFITFADSVTSDPDDDTAVLATFEGSFWDGQGDVQGPQIVTVATVAAGAVTTADGATNPETAIPVQALSLAAGETFAPNLTGVGTIDASANTVSFVFDKDVNVFFDDAFRIVIQPSGGIQPVTLGSTAAVVDPGGTSITATFPDFAADADIRRAWVDDCAAEGLQIFGPFMGTTLCVTQSVAVTDDGTTFAADLTLVEEDQDASTVDFTFDTTLDIGQTLDPADFHVYFIDGSTTPGSAATVLGNNQTVRVQFAPLQVTDGILGAGVREGAVVAANGFTSQHDERGFARSFPAGTTAGGSWTGATLEEGTTGTQLVLTFNRLIPDLNGDDEPGDRITLYEGDGTPIADALSGCTIDPGLGETTVTCDVAADAVADAMLVGLRMQTLSGDVTREFFDTRIGNVEASMELVSAD